MAETVLDVEFQFVNGVRERFSIDSLEAARVLIDHLKSDKVFLGQSLIVSEQNCLAAYRTTAIVRIDISGPGTPKWPYMRGAKSVTEVTEEHFESALNDGVLTKERVLASQQPGLRQEGFTVLHLITGQRIIWDVVTASTEMVAIDATQAARQLLNSPSLHADRIDGGLMLINVAHVTRLAFYPGPPKKSDISTLSATRR